MARKDGKDRGIIKDPRGRKDAEGRDIYWIEYNDQFGRRHREKVGTKAQARAAYEARKTSVRQEKFDPDAAARRKPKQLIEDAIRDYLVEVKPLTRDWDHMQRHGKLWQGVLKGNTLAEVTPQMIERWRSKRLRERSPATVNRAITFLKRFYNLAVQHGLVDKNPCAYIKKVKENNSRVRFLTWEEQDAVQKALKPRSWPFVLIALGTGLRLSEMLNLRWQNVDLANRVVTVPQSKHGEARHIPLRADITEVFRALPSRVKSQWVIPAMDGKGALSRAGWLRRDFEAALKTAAAEVPTLEDFHWHDLRHTFASRLAMDGVDILAIQKLMGHKTLQMTLRYAHLSPSHLREAIERPALHSPARTATPTATKKTATRKKPTAKRD